MDILTIVSLLIIAAGSVIYYFYRNYLTYWKNKNVPHLRTFRKFLDIFLYNKCPAMIFEEIYNDPKLKDEALVGIHVLHRPGLLIRDPELIKKVLVKDFNDFQDRFSTADQHKDLLGSNNLFFKTGPKWKYIRNGLTPVFTSGKIKQMFSLVNDIGKELDKHICSLTDNPSKMTEQEVKSMSQLYTIDVIASIAYGIDAHSITNPDADFLKHGRAMFDFTRWRSLEFSSVFFLPDLISFLNVKVFNKKGTEFLTSTFRHVLNEREKSQTLRHDLIQALINLKKQQQSETDPDKILDEITLIAQASLFFTAGFETSSSTMSFTLWECAKRPVIQKRLRQEIKEALEKNNGELTYDIIQNMEYLNMMIQETLRLYPILPFLDRIYNNPKGEEYSLEPFCNGSIKNGTAIYIPVHALQRDEKYFKNPDEFSPERFSIENKGNIIPYSYMPFGTGPRNCIGERFGLIQTKVGLVYVLKNHRIEMSERTAKEFKMEKKALLLQSEGGTYCNLVRDPIY